MNLLYKLIHGQVCKSTHHKLIIDALMGIQGHANETWQNYFLSEYRTLLDGAKMPDTQFRDFKNHVLHTNENNWGGAVSSAQEWLQKSLKMAKDHRWQELPQAVGILSHYISDPFMPLHTGQTEAEGIIHRACEWSVTRSYDQLKTILDTELGGVSRARKQNGENWLQQLITQGAQTSHKCYDDVVARYNLKVGTQDPVAGLDQISRRHIAKCLGECISGLTMVLEKIMEQAGALPPVRSISAHDILRNENISQSWLKKNLQDKEEQQSALKILDEVNSRGKAVHSLSQECQDVRRLHAEQVLKVSLSDLDQEPITIPGQKYGQADSRVFSQNQSIEKYLTISLPGNGSESVYKTRRLAPGEVREPSRYRKTLNHLDDFKRLRGVEGMNIPRVNLTASSTRGVMSGQESLGNFQKIKEPASATSFAPPHVPHHPTQINSLAGEHVEDYAEGFNDQYTRRDDRHIKYPADSPEVDSHYRSTRVDHEHNDIPSTREEKHRLKQLRKQQRREQQHYGNFQDHHNDTTYNALEKSQSLSPRYTMESPIVDAPGIGPKTARRFNHCGIQTIGQFLQADVHQLAEKLNAGHITPQQLSEWQIQARWGTILPKFRAADAHAFIALDLRAPQDLNRYDAESLLMEITHFLQTPEGAKLSRESQPPKIEHVQIWIDSAKKFNHNAA